MNNIIEIAESLKEFVLLIKDLGVFLTLASKTEAGEQKREFLGMLLDSLGASSLGNLLTGIGTIRAGEKTFRAGESFFRAGQDFQCHLIL